LSGSGFLLYICSPLPHCTLCRGLEEQKKE
jgi:hypothetical protein